MKPPTVVDEALCEALPAFASKMERIQQYTLRADGLTLSYRGYRVLVRISSGRTTLTRIGRTATITYSAISQAIAAVEARGYVRRRTAATDHRTVELAVSPRGQIAMAEAQQSLHGFVRRLFAGVPEKDVASFATTLSVLAGNLDAIANEMGLRPDARSVRRDPRRTTK